MIIKGKSITGPEALGPYLSNVEKNERVEVLEIRGTIAQDLVGALVEMDAYAEGTKCEKPLYHGKINPEPPYRLSVEQALEAVDALEKELGLEGHARVVVMHEKDGRQHFHPVWARIDLENMRAVPDSHNYRKHEEVARDLERRFEHPRVQGAHAERDGVPRPDRSPSRSELRQESHTGIRARDVREEVTAAFQNAANANDFVAALESKGYALARGDRRDFVLVDRAGGVHSLPRRIEGVNAAELREFMKPIDHSALPKVEQVKEAQIDRQQGRLSLLDQMDWEDALTRSGVQRDVKAEKQRDERDRATRKGRREARRDSTIEKGYAQGGDFASQSRAATNDVERRIKLRGEQPAHPSQHKAKASRDFSKGKAVADRGSRSENVSDDRPIGTIQTSSAETAKSKEAWKAHPDLADKPKSVSRKAAKQDRSWEGHPDIADAKRGNRIVEKNNAKGRRAAVSQQRARLI